MSNPPGSENLTPQTCKRCGRQDGLNATVSDDVWKKLSPDVDNVLCLWCMDEIAYDLGIEAPVVLHFAGRALYGTSE